MSRFTQPLATHQNRFPRSRGDEPIDNVREQLAYWFSPLTRG